MPAVVVAGLVRLADHDPPVVRRVGAVDLGDRGGRLALGVGRAGREPPARRRRRAPGPRAPGGGATPDGGERGPHCSMTSTLARGITILSAAEVDLEDPDPGLRRHRVQVDRQPGDGADPAEVRRPDAAHRRADVEAVVGAVDPGLVGLGRVRHDDLGPDHAGPDLGGAVDRGALAVEAGQQVVGRLGHRDVAEALGHDQRRRQRLGAGDRDADVVAEQVLDVLVGEAAADHGGDLVLDRGAQRGQGGPAAADHDLAGVGGLDVAGVEDLVGPGGDDDDRRGDLAGQAEDALDQRGPGLDDHALVGDDVDHLAVDVGGDLDRDRRLAEHRAAGHLRHALEGAVDGRGLGGAEQAEEAA